MSTNTVPPLKVAVQEIIALCTISQELYKSETKRLVGTIETKLKLLSQIRAHHGITDHYYLESLVKMRDKLAPLVQAAAVTKMISEEMAAINQKAAKLEKMLSQPDCHKAFALHSISTIDAFLDVNGHTSPLFLNYVTKGRQYKVADWQGTSRPFWSQLKFSINPNSPKYDSIKNAVYAGKRIILAPENKKGSYQSAFFIEMLNLEAADAFLKHLCEFSEVVIWPKAPQQIHA